MCNSMNNLTKNKSGFTLIELSIVLVIIGLIVGGVLVGRDLISAAGVRAQISQIESYQTSVNTFRGKYQFLPGDMPTADASKFGLSLDTNGNGGDGNFIIGNSLVGESNLFWMQLGDAKLIHDSIHLADWYGVNATGTGIALYLPNSILGRSMYVNVWNGGYSTCHPAGSCPGIDGVNYFGLYTWTSFCHNWCSSSINFAIKVVDASKIDLKMDDGFPQSGKVLALIFGPNYGATWAGSSDYGAGWHAPPPDGGPTTDPGAASETSCYDNGNVAGVMRYSMTTNNGNGANCALSFKFQ